MPDPLPTEVPTLRQAAFDAVTAFTHYGQPIAAADRGPEWQELQIRMDLLAIALGFERPPSMSTIITTNPHDSGFDLVLGTDVTGPSIGGVCWERNGGLVLRVDGDDETYLPDDASECAVILANMGLALTVESLADISGLESGADA